MATAFSARLGATSLEGLRDSRPLTFQALLASEAEVRALGGMGAAPVDWAGCPAAPREKRQGGLERRRPECED